MEKIKKEVFETWIKKNNWFKLNDVATPNGQQQMYLTPAGSLMIAQYDLEKNLAQVMNMVPVTQQPPQGQELSQEFLRSIRPT